MKIHYRQKPMQTEYRIKSRDSERTENRSPNTKKNLYDILVGTASKTFRMLMSCLYATADNGNVRNTQ